MKQVRPWTYPSMVYVPLCAKLVMSDINRGNSPWASSIATLYHPPVGNEELRLSFLLAHCIVNVENKLATLFAFLPEHYQLLCLLTCMCNQLQGLCYKKGFFHGMICIATTDPLRQGSDLRLSMPMPGTCIVTRFLPLCTVAAGHW